MTRRELRENVFKMLFRVEFLTRENCQNSWYYLARKLTM